MGRKLLFKSGHKKLKSADKNHTFCRNDAPQNIVVNHMFYKKMTARRNNALINWKENMVNHKNRQIRLDIPATLKTHENRSAYSKMVNRRGILNTLVNMYLLISVFSFNLIILSFDWLENPWLDLVRHLDDLCLFVFY